MKDADPWSQDLRRLGLPSRATWKQIESRYQRLALSLHPDVNRTRAAAERFRRVAAAYQRLSTLRTERWVDAEKDPKARSLPPEELALRLRYSSSAPVRAASALLLGRTEGKETSQVLLAALRDPDGQVREASLEALGCAGRPLDLPALLAAVWARKGVAALPACRCAARILRRGLGSRRK